MSWFLRMFAGILAKFLKWWVRDQKPNFIIRKDNGLPYLYRWWFIPRNRYFNVYLHKVVRDDERFFHDHPWNSVGLILEGAYTEYTPKHRPVSKKYLTSDDISFEILDAGSLKYRNMNYAHYLIVGDQNDHYLDRTAVWSLFMTGRKKADWGFYDRESKKWVDHVTWLSERGKELSRY